MQATKIFRQLCALLFLIYQTPHFSAFVCLFSLQSKDRIPERFEFLGKTPLASTSLPSVNTLRGRQISLTLSPYSRLFASIRGSTSRFHVSSLKSVTSCSNRPRFLRISGT